MMSSKFLQVFGCTIDVAVDGVGAVEMMNGEVRFSAHGKFLFRNRWFVFV
jgi:hypothetical protein